MKYLIIILYLSFPVLSVAQPSVYSCQSKGGEYLNKMIGRWEVSTKDRTSPGIYEKNFGISIIEKSIPGCGVSESFKGTFRGNDYAREVNIFALDSVNMQMTALDSEHGSFSVLDGGIVDDQMIVTWYRNKDVKRLQSKYILTWTSPDEFEFSSFLSTDHAKSWALTHERKYKRTSMIKTLSDEEEVLVQAIRDYHDGFSSNQPEKVRSVLGQEFTMFNGNFSDIMTDWQAHMFVSGNEIEEWSNFMLTEAGPHQNEFEVTKASIRGNAGLVVTKNTGSNKFRKWKNEKVVWWLGRKENDWKITGLFIRDISNPE